MKHFDRNNQQIFVGSHVLWYDPQEEVRDLTRAYDVDDIYDNGIILISDEFSEAEVFENELEVVG